MIITITNTTTNYTNNSTIIVTHLVLYPVDYSWYTNVNKSQASTDCASLTRTFWSVPKPLYETKPASSKWIILIVE